MPHDRPEIPTDRLVATIEATSDFVGLARADGTVEFLNQAAKTLLGLPAEVDLRTLRTAQFHPPETLERLHAVGYSAAVRDGTWTGDGELLDARGVRIPVSIVLIAHRSADGVSFSFMMRDRRARAREKAEMLATEAALRKTDRRFRAAIDGSLDGVLVLATVKDEKGVIVDFDIVEANPRAAMMVSMPREDLVGQRICELFPINRSAGHFDRWVEVVSSQATLEWEFESIDPRVGPKWIRCQAVPMEDGVSLSLRDISIEKTAEGDLRLLLDVAREAANAPDTDALLRDLLGAICDANHWDYCEAWLGDDTVNSRPDRRAIWHSGSDDRLIPFADAIDDMKHFADGDLPALAWVRRSVVVARSASDLSAAPARRRAAIAARLSAGVAVPVFAGQQLVAVLSFYARDKRTVDDRRLELLGAVASEIGAILAHKLSEQALANERAFLSAVLDSLSENVSVCDAEGRLTLFNRATRETHGLPEDPDVSSEDWAKHYAVFASDGVTPFRADQMPHVRVRETGQPVEGVEFVVAVPGRAPRTMVANARVMRGQHGEIIGSVCAARDVTSRREAQRALLESERRFRQVLENVRSIAVTLDTNGNITFANEALLASTGWTRGEVEGKSWFELFVPKEGGRGQRFHDSVARNDVTTHLENDILTRDGERRLIEWDTTAMRDATGALVGTASIGRDVTDQRALEARLAALSENDELTGLANRRGFRRMAEQELKSGRRSGRRGAVLYIDVNDLKPINDTYGHAGGDDALRTVARTLRDSVRDADLVARLGGDEFGVFATGVAALAEADILVARLFKQLAEANAHDRGSGRQFSVSFSVGISLVEPGDDLDMLLARADAALYVQKAARKAGR